MNNQKNVLLAIALSAAVLFLWQYFVATPSMKAEQARQTARYAVAARAALDAGLGVNAGHDLNRANLTWFLQSVPQVSEVSIGHALIADALELGYAATITDYLRCIDDAFAAPGQR